VTPEALAALHGRCFETPRPWTVAEFRGLLAMPGVFLNPTDGGFALGRVIVDEAELLTLVVDPPARRRGLGSTLLADFETSAASRGATSAMLEVSADNAAAIALYTTAGFRRTGTRPGYYRTPNGARIDAHLFAKALS
jgi:ribosomal-protein-alanine N-acetyltransferase